MREIGIRRFDVAVCSLALVALFLGGAGPGLTQAQEATPVAGEQPIPVSTEPATFTPTASATTPPANDQATPAPKPRTLAVQANTVPSISATNFSPVTSTFAKGYPSVSMTATITLSAPGDVSTIAPWQVTIQGDSGHPLAATTTDGFAYFGLSQLEFGGLGAPVTGVIADNVGQPLSENFATALQIAHGDGSEFTSGTPNVLSFEVVIVVSPNRSDPPGTYTGRLILTVSQTPPSTP